MAPTVEDPLAQVLAALGRIEARQQHLEAALARIVGVLPYKWRLQLQGLFTHQEAKRNAGHSPR